MVKPGMADSDSNPTFNESCSTTNNISSNKMYKGVRKRKWGKWVSEIRLPNSRERIWLGSYDTQEKAARAFDAALYCLRGKSASFNFPDTPLNLEDINVADQSLSPQKIQEVAAKFANDPPMESKQEDPLSESQSGADSFGLFDQSNNLYGYDGSVQVDQHGGDLKTTDWTFLDMLDDLNGVACSDFGHSAEFLCSNAQPPLLFEDEIEGDHHDAFSNHSFLWSWNF